MSRPSVEIYQPLMWTLKTTASSTLIALSITALRPEPITAAHYKKSFEYQKIEYAQTDVTLIRGALKFFNLERVYNPDK